MILPIIILSIVTALGVTGMFLAIRAVIDVTRFEHLKNEKEYIESLERFDVEDFRK